MPTETLQPYATDRDVFVDMVRILSARGWTRSVGGPPSYGPRCIYSGIGCAIGCLPVCKSHAEDWDPLGTIRAVASLRNEAFQACFAPTVSVGFLTGCQRAHDWSPDPAKMKRCFKTIADQQEFDPPLPPDILAALSA